MASSVMISTNYEEKGLTLLEILLSLQSLESLLQSVFQIFLDGRLQEQLTTIWEN